MKIYTKVVMSIATGKILDSESYEYEGPIVLLKGGSTTTTSVDEAYNARMAEIAEAQQAMAEEHYGFYKDYYQPYEKEQISANRELVPLQMGLQKTALGVAKEGLDPGTAMDEAQADVAQSFAGAQGSIGRNLARRGVRMDSGQGAQMQRDLVLGRAKAIGGARTMARQNVRDKALTIGGMGPSY